MIVELRLSNNLLQAMTQLTSALEQSGLLETSERATVMNSIASSAMHSLALLAGVMNVYMRSDLCGARSREAEAAESIKLYARELEKALDYGVTA